MDSEINLKIYPDGNKWCAVYHDHIDLHQSPAGFGDTVPEAVEDLLNQDITQYPK